MAKELWILLLSFLSLISLIIIFENSEYLWYYISIPLLIIGFFFLWWTYKWLKTLNWFKKLMK